MKRGAAVAALLACLLVLPVAGAAVTAPQDSPGDSAAVAPRANGFAQVNESENSTTAPAWEEPGPFSVEELRRGGTHPTGDADTGPPASTRMLGEPVRGGVYVRYTPVNPLENNYEELEPEQRLNGDTLEFFSNAYGDAAGEYELVIVYWQPATASVDGAERRYASNQTVQRVNLNLDEGYSTSKVRLHSHYEETWQATAWLERGGEPVEGARWRFKHASAPASQQVQIQTLADAWKYVFRVAILPGIAAIAIGLTLAQATLKKVGRPPGYGLVLWVFLGGGVGAMVVSGLYYEVAVVIANLDILFGLSLGVIAYGGGLRMHAPVEKVAFERKELTDAVALRQQSQDGDSPPEGTDPLADGGTPTGSPTDVIQIPADGYHDELYEDLEILPTIRSEDGGRLVPMGGLMPFLSRLFAKPARLNLSSMRTRVRVEGSSIDEKVYVDPDSEEAVTHAPASLKRRMPVWHRVTDEMDWGERALYAGLTAVTMALPLIGWHAGEAVANVPTVGAAVGLLVLAIESYGAHDGSVDFTPAPRHDMTADASLVVMQQEHADAKTLEEYEEIAWSERSRTALEAREVESRRDKSIVQRMNERALGMGLDVVGRDQAATNGHAQPEKDVIGGPLGPEDEEDDDGN